MRSWRLAMVSWSPVEIWVLRSQLRRCSWLRRWWLVAATGLANQSSAPHRLGHTPCRSEWAGSVQPAQTDSLWLTDAGEHDQEAPPHPCREQRRGQCRARWRRLHHAERRDRKGWIPSRVCAHAAPGTVPSRAPPSGFTWPVPDKYTNANMLIIHCKFSLLSRTFV